MVDNGGKTVSKAESTGTTTYAWDFENRLTSVTLPGTGGTVSFKYDPFVSIACGGATMSAKYGRPPFI